jgi:hypothetical protein
MDDNDLNDLDIFGGYGLNNELDDEEKERDEIDEHDNYDAQAFRDRERAQMGLKGARQQEMGAGAIPNRFKSRRDKALFEIGNISNNSPFFDLKDEVKLKIDELLVKLKDIENYYLPLLYSASVFVVNKKELNAKNFDAHITKYSISSTSKGEDNLSRDEVDALTVLRYIRKLKFL